MGTSVPAIRLNHQYLFLLHRVGAFKRLQFSAEEVVALTTKFQR